MIITGTSKDAGLARRLRMVLHGIGIKAKISLGFVSVLFILAGVSALGLFALVRIEGAFRVFDARVADVGVGHEVDRTVVELRKAVLAYALLGSGEEQSNVRARAEAAGKSITAGMSVITNTQQLGRLEEINKTFKNFMQDFDGVVDLKERQANLEKTVLDPGASQMLKDLEALRAVCQSADDAQAASFVIKSEHLLADIRVDLSRVVGRASLAAAEDAEANFNTLNFKLAALVKTDTGPLLGKTYADIVVRSGEYHSAARQTQEINKELHDLVYDTMQQEGDSISGVADTIVTASKGEEQAVEQSTAQTLHAMKRLIGGLALGGFALGLVVAWSLGSAIAAPVVGMTEAMRKLAGGDLGVVVPGLGQGDEVGHMAETLEMFKVSMTEAGHLREEQDAVKTRAETQRRAEMDALAEEFETRIEAVVRSVTGSASALKAKVELMLTGAEQASEQAVAAATSAGQASVNVQTVASAAEQLSGSINEISSQISVSSRTTQEAKDKAAATNELIGSLADTAQKIGDVVTLISTIASQTNLLALNATIEAARAGEAGKGFAVVASEVKQLANQTAKATDAISRQIAEVQEKTHKAVSAIRAIVETINEVSQTSNAIASAVEEQQAATGDIARNVEEAAHGTREVAANIEQITQAAHTAVTTSGEALTGTASLAEQAEILDTQVTAFIARIRAG